jgi:hypothetical protein
VQHLRDFPKPFLSFGFHFNIRYFIYLAQLIMLKVKKEWSYTASPPDTMAGVHLGIGAL